MTNIPSFIVGPEETGLIPSAEDHCARLSSLDDRKRSSKKTSSFRPPSRILRRSKEAFETDSERLITRIAIPGNWYEARANLESEIGIEKALSDVSSREL